jgi:glycyl-tRNA synthetase beta chain
MSELLLEIGVEEIPAWMIEPALEDFRKKLAQAFAGERLGEPQLELHATPRRITAHAADLPAIQPDMEELLAGPPKAAPPQAAEAFAKKCGVSRKRLHVMATPKGEYWAYKKKTKGQKTAALLRTLLPATILKIYWPKTMYWGNKSGPRFIRPIRSLLALFDGKVVRFEIGGVKSGAVTFGHRLLGLPRLKVGGFDEYVRVLRENGVILDAQERFNRILETPRSPREGLEFKLIGGLVEELANMTEYPTSAVGSFDPSFLALPKEVLETVMIHHQKYIPMETSEGRLAPYFVFVMNRDSDPDGLIRHGNERVLRARFNDARFFWDTDQKVPLRDRGPLLEKVTFRTELDGSRTSYAEKTQRVVALARKLAPQFGADPEATARAAELCKADLTTELVKEFTELQGVVGGLYARVQGETEKVAAAIYDHYQPESMDDSSPATPEGAALSVADKLDTLVDCFAAGRIPSGSRDPLGLRRAAQGVVKILADHNCASPLSRLLPVGSPPELAEFFKDRLRFYLREVRRFAYDEVNAILAAGDQNVPDCVARCEAIARVRPTENFEPLSMAFKRIRNILTKAGGAEKFPGEPQEPLLEEGPERDLYREAGRIFTETADLADYEAVLRRTADLRPFVDTYFDTVLVMAKDERVRQNRLTLLAWLLRAFTRVADFSEIVTTREKEKENSNG